MMDIQVDVGDTPQSAHTGYWKNETVIRETAQLSTITLCKQYAETLLGDLTDLCARRGISGLMEDGIWAPPDTILDELTLFAMSTDRSRDP